MQHDLPRAVLQFHDFYVGIFDAPLTDSGIAFANESLVISLVQRPPPRSRWGRLKVGLRIRTGCGTSARSSSPTVCLLAFFGDTSQLAPGGDGSGTFTLTIG